jgi:hypothetical protein
LLAGKREGNPRTHHIGHMQGGLMRQSLSR